MGKLTLFGIICIGVFGAVMWRALGVNLPQNWVGWTVISFTVVFLMIVGLFVYAIVRTTDKHPELAAIEGMDLVKLRLGLGAKGMDTVPEQEPMIRPAISIQPTLESAK